MKVVVVVVRATVVDGGDGQAKHFVDDQEKDVVTNTY